MGWIGRSGQLLLAESTGWSRTFDPKGGKCEATKTVPNPKGPIRTSPTDDRYVAEIWTERKPASLLDILFPPTVPDICLAIGRVGREVPEASPVVGAQTLTVCWSPDGTGVFFTADRDVFFTWEPEQGYLDLRSRTIRRYYGRRNWIFDVGGFRGIP